MTEFPPSQTPVVPPVPSEAGTLLTPAPTEQKKDNYKPEAKPDRAPSQDWNSLLRSGLRKVANFFSLGALESKKPSAESAYVLDSPATGPALAYDPATGLLTDLTTNELLNPDQVALLAPMIRQAAQEGDEAARTWLAAIRDSRLAGGGNFDGFGGLDPVGENLLAEKFSADPAEAEKALVSWLSPRLGELADLNAQLPLGELEALHAGIRHDLENALKANPQIKATPELIRLKARLDTLTGEFLARATREGPPDARKTNERKALHFYEEAVKSLDGLINQTPDDPSVLLMRADVNDQLGHYELAADDLRRLAHLEMAGGVMSTAKPQKIELYEKELKRRLAETTLKRVLVETEGNSVMILAHLSEELKLHLALGQMQDAERLRRLVVGSAQKVHLETLQSQVLALAQQAGSEYIALKDAARYVSPSTWAEKGPPSGLEVMSVAESSLRPGETVGLTYTQAFEDLNYEEKLAALSTLQKELTIGIHARGVAEARTDTDKSYHLGIKALLENNQEATRLHLGELIKLGRGATDPQTQSRLIQARQILKPLTLEAIVRLKEASRGMVLDHEARMIGSEGFRTTGDWQGLFLDYVEQLVQSGKAATIEEAIGLLVRQDRENKARFLKDKTVHDSGFSVMPGEWRIRDKRGTKLHELERAQEKSFVEFNRLFKQDPSDPHLRDMKAYKGLPSVKLDGGTIHVDGDKDGPRVRVVIGKKGGTISLYSISNGHEHMTFPPGTEERVVYIDPLGRIMAHHLGTKYNYPVRERAPHPQLAKGPDGSRDPALARLTGGANNLSWLFKDEGGRFNWGQAERGLLRGARDSMGFMHLLGMELNEGLKDQLKDKRAYQLSLADAFREAGSYSSAGQLYEALLEPRVQEAIEGLDAGAVQKGAFHIRFHERDDIRKSIEASLHRQKADNPEAFAARFGQWPNDAEIGRMIGEAAETKARLKLAYRDMGEAYDRDGALGDHVMSQAWHAYNDMEDPNEEWFNFQDRSWDAIADELVMTAITMPLTMGVGSVVKSTVGATRLAIRLAGSTSRLARGTAVVGLAATRNFAEALVQTDVEKRLGHEESNFGWNFLMSLAFHGGGGVARRLGGHTAEEIKAAERLWARGAMHADNFARMMGVQTSVATVMGAAHEWVDTGDVHLSLETVAQHALRMINGHIGSFLFHRTTGRHFLQAEQRVDLAHEMAGRAARATESSQKGFEMGQAVLQGGAVDAEVVRRIAEHENDNKDDQSKKDEGGDGSPPVSGEGGHGASPHILAESASPSPDSTSTRITDASERSSVPLNSGAVAPAPPKPRDPGLRPGDPSRKPQVPALPNSEPDAMPAPAAPSPPPSPGSRLKEAWARIKGSMGNFIQSDPRPWAQVAREAPVVGAMVRGAERVYGMAEEMGTFLADYVMGNGPFDGGMPVLATAGGVHDSPSSQVRPTAPTHHSMMSMDEGRSASRTESDRATPLREEGYDIEPQGGTRSDAGDAQKISELCKKDAADLTPGEAKFLKDRAKELLQSDPEVGKIRDDKKLTPGVSEEDAITLFDEVEWLITSKLGQLNRELRGQPGADQNLQRLESIEENAGIRPEVKLALVKNARDYLALEDRVREAGVAPDAIDGILVGSRNYREITAQLKEVEVKAREKAAEPSPVPRQPESPAKLPASHQPQAGHLTGPEARFPDPASTAAPVNERLQALRSKADQGGLTWDEENFLRSQAMKMLRARPELERLAKENGLSPGVSVDDALTFFDEVDGLAKAASSASRVPQVPAGNKSPATAAGQPTEIPARAPQAPPPRIAETPSASPRSENLRQSPLLDPARNEALSQIDQAVHQAPHLVDPMRRFMEGILADNNLPLERRVEMLNRLGELALIADALTRRGIGTEESVFDHARSVSDLNTFRAQADQVLAAHRSSDGPSISPPQARLVTPGISNATAPGVTRRIGNGGPTTDNGVATRTQPHALPPEPAPQTRPAADGPQGSETTSQGGRLERTLRAPGIEDMSYIQSCAHAEFPDSLRQIYPEPADVPFPYAVRSLKARFERLDEIMEDLEDRAHPALYRLAQGIRYEESLSLRAREDYLRNIEEVHENISRLASLGAGVDEIGAALNRAGSTQGLQALADSYVPVSRAEAEGPLVSEQPSEGAPSVLTESHVPLDESHYTELEGLIGQLRAVDEALADEYGRQLQEVRETDFAPADALDMLHHLALDIRGRLPTPEETQTPPSLTPEAELSGRTEATLSSEGIPEPARSDESRAEAVRGEESGPAPADVLLLEGRRKEVESRIVESFGVLDNEGLIGTLINRSAAARSEEELASVESALADMMCLQRLLDQGLGALRASEKKTALAKRINDLMNQVAEGGVLTPEAQRNLNNLRTLSQLPESFWVSAFENVKDLKALESEVPRQQQKFNREQNAEQRIAELHADLLTKLPAHEIEEALNGADSPTAQLRALQSLSNRYAWYESTQKLASAVGLTKESMKIASSADPLPVKMEKLARLVDGKADLTTVRDFPAIAKMEAQNLKNGLGPEWQGLNDTAAMVGQLAKDANALISVQGVDKNWFRGAKELIDGMQAHGGVDVRMILALAHMIRNMPRESVNRFFHNDFGKSAQQAHGARAELLRAYSAYVGSGGNLILGTFDSYFSTELNRFGRTTGSLVDGDSRNPEGSFREFMLLGKFLRLGMDMNLNFDRRAQVPLTVDRVEWDGRTLDIINGRPRTGSVDPEAYMGANGEIICEIKSRYGARFGDAGDFAEKILLQAHKYREAIRLGRAERVEYSFVIDPRMGYSKAFVHALFDVFGPHAGQVTVKIYDGGTYKMIEQRSGVSESVPVSSKN